MPGDFTKEMIGIFETVLKLIRDKMINLLFRLFLTFNSTSLIIVVYLVKNQKVFNVLNPSLEKLPHFVSYIIYFLIPAVLTFLSLVK